MRDTEYARIHVCARDNCSPKISPSAGSGRMKTSSYWTLNRYATLLKIVMHVNRISGEKEKISSKFSQTAYQSSIHHHQLRILLHSACWNTFLRTYRLTVSDQFQSSSLSIKIPKDPKTKRDSKRAFKSHVCSLWNDLPGNMKICETLMTFNTHTKSKDTSFPEIVTEHFALELSTSTIWSFLLL